MNYRKRCIRMAAFSKGLSVSELADRMGIPAELLESRANKLIENPEGIILKTAFRCIDESPHVDIKVNSYSGAIKLVNAICRAAVYDYKKAMKAAKNMKNNKLIRDNEFIHANHIATQMLNNGYLDALGIDTRIAFEHLAKSV